MAWKPDYVTLAEFKNFVNVPDDDTADDVEFAMFITAASRNVDKRTRRQFGNTGTAQDRYYTPQWDVATGRWLVEVDDIQNVAGLTVAIDPTRDQTFSTLVTSYTLEPRNAAVDGKPYESILLPAALSTCLTTADVIKVHSIFGWNTAPAAVPLATKLQAARYSGRRHSPFGVVGSPNDQSGGEIALTAKLDPDVVMSLLPYVRTWWAR